jgi:prokaryotic ubiquitin-like protein Pup
MAREGGQQHKSPKKSSETDEATEVQSGEDVAERKEKLDEDIDAILEDIDDVLETNAEEFVRGFVQKGGE